MYEKQSILALILARGGSKRLPGKNVKWIGGKPMIAWTIEAAKKSKYIDRVIVSTDSEEIASVSKKYGAETPFKRPDELASDTASSIDAVFHVLKWLKDNEKKEYDFITLLQPTSPLRTAEHLDEAIEQMMGNDHLDAMNSFYAWDKKPDWIHAVGASGFLENALKMENSFTVSTQCLVPNGAMYIIKSDILFKEKTFYPKKLGYYLMKRADSVDVDTQEDFDLANFLIKQKNTSKKSIVIRNYEINEGKRVFVIAEAGVNHNGDLEKAIALVDLAAEIGADAIKFQTFKAEQVVTEKGDMAEYQKRNLGFEKTQREMLKDLELPENFYPPIMERCKEKQILFLSTPHGGKESVDFLEYLGVPAHKIGSGDLTHYILLDKIARTGKPIILATGMATLDEVKDAVEFIKSKGNHQIIVLHCTSNYPCPPVDVNMAAMKTLMRELDVPVGYSDHTEGLTAAIMATTLGAALYEFHFTLDKNLPGPDHRASANPEEAKERVKAIRQASLMMGNSAKEATVDEKKFTLPIARRSIVAAKNFKKGALISFNDIEAKRPADGLSPIHYEKIIGKTAKKDYKKDEQIRLDDFV